MGWIDEVWRNRQANLKRENEVIQAATGIYDWWRGKNKKVKASTLRGWLTAPGVGSLRELGKMGGYQLPQEFDARLLPILNEMASKRGGDPEVSFDDMANAYNNKDRWSAAADWSANAAPDAWKDHNNFTHLNAGREALSSSIGLAQAWINYDKKRKKAQAAGEDMAAWDRKNSTPTQRQEQLNALHGAMQEQGLSWDQQGYRQLVDSLQALQTSANWLNSNVNDIDALLTDEGDAHVGQVLENSRGAATGRLMQSFSPEQYKALQDNRGKLQFLRNNRGQLRTLNALRKNPLMWLFKALFSSNPSRLYGAVRSLQSTYNNPNSDWGKYLGPRVAEYKQYMPWLRLLHNIRGAMSGDPNFTPIIHENA